jgi:hypothetical protein
MDPLPLRYGATGSERISRKDAKAQREDEGSNSRKRTQRTQRKNKPEIRAYSTFHLSPFLGLAGLP